MSIQPDDVKLSLTALKQPLQLGPLTLKCRIIMASLTRSRSVPDDVPNEFNVSYYAARAAGGAGLILSEGTLGEFTIAVPRNQCRASAPALFTCKKQ